MSNSSFTPTLTGLSRVFIIEGRARPDHEPEYQSCLMAGSVDQAFGDIEKIECPSPDSYGQFDEVGQIQGAIERASMPLTGRYALDVISELLRLARKRCANDVQVHFGKCSDPSDFDEFKKALIFEQAFLTNFSSEDLGALASDENAVINESADLSARDVYEVVPLNVASRGGDTVTNPLEDVVICSKPECGDCDDEDDGCQDIYAVGDSSPGSPGTAPDVIYSTDSGATLAADEITTLTNSENADGIACLKTWVVVVSNDDGGIHYKLRATIDAGTAGAWTRNATNIVVGGEPNDIWSVGTYAFVVGDGGYIYGFSNPASITVLDAAQTTTNNLLAVHALNRNFAVAVGASGTVVFTRDRVTWQSATAPAAVTLQCVWVKNKDEWWVGASNGAVYYTLDGGSSWTQFTDFPVTLTNVEDIAFSTDSVGYLGGNVAGPSAVLLRTYNGGNTWRAMPEGVGTLPAGDEVTALAACKHDANFVVGVGLADDAADGYYVIGNA